MTDSLKGRRSGAVVYAPRGVDTGAITYVDADGKEVWLEYPAGAALGDYVLATGDADVPVWLPAADLVAGGTPVTVSDGMGGFTVVFDEDGNVVYAS